MKHYVLAAIIGGFFISAAVSAQTTDACQSYIPAGIGGPMVAIGDDRVVFRWLANIELPGTRFLAPLYRSPICVMTSGPKRGDAQFKP